MLFTFFYRTKNMQCTPYKSKHAKICVFMNLIYAVRLCYNIYGTLIYHEGKMKDKTLEVYIMLKNVERILTSFYFGKSIYMTTIITVGSKT